MSRVINLDSPGKNRNQLMRTAAEVLRRLSVKTTIDDESRDMAALLVYCFREIHAGIDDSVRAWEKRNYWVKAEQFRLRWAWVKEAAGQLERVVTEGDWDSLPVILIEVLPHFQDIKVARYTRKPSLWQGTYKRLLSENGSGAAHQEL
jgi:hypothetical protein